MKQLIGRLSRVSDSPQYSLLRCDSHHAHKGARQPRRGETFRAKLCQSSSKSQMVPQGHVPVYVGDELERFVVSAQLLNHPIFVKLLNKSAQEYGYEQKGVLRIPCYVDVFERVLEALRLAQDSSCDLLNSIMSSDDFF
ncbi:auxin-responsive protein SAUR71-like [Juglans regia]|uniref:Auxin-responsive protein SAUR71-like n=1 Tax=Juglans regia TaxID=51240 RepID=A0A2I4F9Z4_JUGRE|nr:auxin-responsive protein SAUR71-like [Juglans regia]